MIWPLAGALVLATTAPHLLPGSRLTPASGIFLWLAVLAVRALLVALLALALILYVPTTQLFQLLTHWCFHAVIPFLAAHLGFSAHSIGDAATLAPAIALAVSLLSAVFAIWRGARRMHHWLRRSSLGAGPRESVIVGGPDVLLAAAGIRRPRLVVSTGALAVLDDDELAAGLEHERGHIARRHPYLATAAELLFALGRLLPGSGQALVQFRFHMERDADEYAIERTGDRLALASVICKAAAGSGARPALIGLTDSNAVPRLRLLMDQSAARPSRLAVLSARGLATLLASLAMFLAVSTPSLARAGFSALQHQGSIPVCQG